MSVRRKGIEIKKSTASKKATVKNDWYQKVSKKTSEYKVNPIKDGGGLIQPPLRIIVMTSWNNDDESLIFTYFSYFGLRKILQLVLSFFVK